MPRLVKGGKYVFGWSRVDAGGGIAIPPEAVNEYGLAGHDEVILMTGSVRSGGFALTTMELLEGSPFAAVLEGEALMARPGVAPGEAVEIRGRLYCRVELTGGERFNVPAGTLRGYGIEPGDRLLVARGSGRAVSFLARGPIIEEALKHPEIESFT